MNEYIPHLVELRTRLIRSLTILFLLFLGLFYIDETLYSWVAAPLLHNLYPSSTLIATEVTSTFTVPMKLAFIVALFLAIPYLFFELWSFIAPGLYKKEKSGIFPLLIASILLFYMGCAFAYFVICPMALQFFAQAAPKEVQVMTDIRHHLDFVLTLLVGGGIAFQVPVFTLALLRANIVTVAQLVYLRPYVIVAAFVIGMLLTPPDVVSQIMLAIPMWGLFEAGLWFGKYIKKH